MRHAQRLLAALLFAAAFLVIGLAPLAAAQAADLNRCPDPKSSQTDLNELATEPAKLRATLSSRIAGPDVAVVTFEDEKIATMPDTSPPCIRAFRWIPDEQRGKKKDGQQEDGNWEVVTIRQVYRVSDKPKLLNVAFEVAKPSNTPSWWPFASVKYLFVGTLSVTPTAERPTPEAFRFSFLATTTVTRTRCSLLWSLVFVSGFYVALVFVTYNLKDADDLKWLVWLAYVFSPVRVSAAWFGEASMSQLQLLIFTLIVAGLLFYHWLTAGVLSNISNELLILLGISAGGSAVAKFTQTQKVSLKAQTAGYLMAKGWYTWPVRPSRCRATAAQLLLTDDRLDIYKFQIAIFTVVVACYVVEAGLASLGGVTISDTMLYLIGISQAVYVGGKAVTDRTTDLEAAVEKMVDLESKIATAKHTSSASPPGELGEFYDEYAKAASTAANEFAALQNRKFPNKYDAARRKMGDLGPQVSTLLVKAKDGSSLAPREQALKEEFESADKAAKEFAALTTTARDLATQDVRNIDPAALKP
jgi:hypothetical protein